MLNLSVNTLTNINSNQLNIYWEIPKTNIENVNVKKFKRKFQIVNQQGYVRNYSTAPQRINAKELAYILGLFEADGSLSCYLEKQYIRMDLVISLEEKDAKLTYWIKNFIGHGQVKLVKYSYDKSKRMSRYIIRSKKMILNFWFPLFDKYPLLTKNKNFHYNWVKKCLETNQKIPKNNLLYPKDIKYIINSSYIKDWIVGFIEGDGSFYIVSLANNKSRAEFNLSQKNEEKLLSNIGTIIGLTGNNKVSKKKDGQCVLTATSLADIQIIVNFMCDPERVRLKGLKKVKFILWLRELRRNPRYGSLKIPDRY